MRRAFADTSYYLSLLNSSDDSHRQAVAFTESFTGRIITTDWIIIELANTLSGLSNRKTLIQFVNKMRADPGIRIVPASIPLFERGWSLYQRRADKAWSLTDCISFIVTQEEKLADALTRDHHFEQAGFRILFK
jgi:predicted nucleic acid-binding protein